LFQGRTIGVIGSGKMGAAILKGLLAQGLSPSQCFASDPDFKKRQTLSRQLRIHTDSSNRAVVQASTIVLLAVKPQQMAEVLQEIRPDLTHRHLVISIAAGLKLSWLQKRLRGIPLVRVMPNLPATVGFGFSAIAAAKTATSHQKALTLAIFSATGEALELPERYFNAITAVSGSGPAYVFFLALAWEKAARQLGLSSSIARRAILKTLEGSLRMLETTSQPPAILIASVASKKGTTEAALKVLAQRKVADHFVQALQAAARRSQELAWH
ncbi:MAG: pyrroline-5-carboxylate reductase, partial [Candidatus Omnitrophica bacterium]|nr:pyrroline-5-carboxylate reductase [Candidatus Omnitrophota bacterium]